MVNIGLVSYVIGGVLFLVLALLLLTSWRGRLQGALLVVASLVSTGWCFLLAYKAASTTIPFSTVFVLDILRDGAWLTFLLGLLGGHDRLTTARPMTLIVHGLWIISLLYGVSIALGLGQMQSAAVERILLILGPLILALAGLVLVEQLYRNTHSEKRWAIKFLCLGIGGMFAYDLYVYSQGLLFQQIDANLWNARGAVNASVVPLIAVSAARNPQWSLNVFVSRHIVFYTASLIGAAIYLLVMAVGGYYIRVYGGSWGVVAQVTFLFGAALVLFIVTFSGQVRAQLKVFLTKHFYKNKYDYREEWLRLIDTLSTPSEDITLRERTIKAVAQIVNSRGGGLWMVQGSNRFVPVARWYMDIPLDALAPVDSAFAEFLRNRQWVIELDEYRRDAMRYKGLVLPDWFASLPQAWLVIPLVQEDQLLGFMVLGQPQTFRILTWEDTDLLKTVGRQVASYLAQHEAAQLLAEARQFDAYNRLTAFIMHDLKNLIAQQSLVVKNAAKHKDNPAFIEDTVSTIENSVRRMNQLLGQLKRGEPKGSARRIGLSGLLTELVAKCGERRPIPELVVANDDIHVYAEPQRLVMVFGHVIRNAQEATPTDGYVHIRLDGDEQYAVVEIEDSGCGMDLTFLRDRLFRPFDSTKGSKGMGIGAYQTREFIRMAGGDVEVTSEPGKGTTFRITLPAIHDGAEQRCQRAEMRK